MQLGEHRQQSGALGGLVVAEGARLSSHEREQGDGVARPESAQRLAAARRDRGGHEAEAIVAKGNRRPKRPAQALEHRLTRLPEPGLEVQVVGGGEAALTVAVVHDPVVAPSAHRRVVDSFDR